MENYFLLVLPSMLRDSGGVTGGESVCRGPAVTAFTGTHERIEPGDSDGERPACMSWG